MSAELELPIVYLDAVTEHTLGTGAGVDYFVAANRYPEPDNGSAFSDPTIEFDLITTTTPHTAASLNVTFSIDGGTPIPVIVNNVFQPGYQGSSTLLGPGSVIRRISINGPTFGSKQVVEINVTADAGAQSLDETWEFTVEDLTPPIVESAQATGRKLVRVVFDEAVDPVTAANPANYGFEPQAETLPAVTPVALSVAIIDAATVDVSVDLEWTHGAVYTVTVTGVFDAFQNLIAAPSNVGTFSGFVPTIDASRRFDLWKMIPEKNRREDLSGDLQRFIACLQDIVDQILVDVDAWSNIIDPDLCDEPYLDAMLADLGNPFAFNLSIDDKRRLVRVLYQAYSQKGTGIGIINLVRFFVGIEVTISTIGGAGWVLDVDLLGTDSILGAGPGLSAYSFNVVSPVTLSDEQRDRISTIANFMKPGHTHLIAIIEP